MSDRCEICGQWSLYPNQHKCPPLWKVWPNHYEEEDAWEIRAADANAAACLWADEYDSGGDYTIVGGGEETVTVKGEDGTEEKFVVQGESVPQYYASIVA